MTFEYKEPDITQNIFNWIISNSKKCRINLAQSGMGPIEYGARNIGSYSGTGISALPDGPLK